MRNPFAALKLEPSEQDRARDAERLHRLVSIAQGVHPDTGKRLRRADLTDLGGPERFQAELWLAVNLAPGQILEDKLFESAKRLLSRLAQEQDFVDRARRYVEGLLAELSLIFERDRNPMHAWEAYQIARINKFDLPEWALRYLDLAAESLIELRERAADGNPPKRETESVGKAIGFGKHPGQTGYLMGAAMFLRDLNIHFEVEDHTRRETARYKSTRVRMISIEEVAKKHRVDTATVRRAIDRMRALFVSDD
jgi:hypothetical protein